MTDVLVDGLTASVLAKSMGLPNVALFDRVTSTMDYAHRLAEAGAKAGTLVVAAEQTMGRGRGGSRWSSRAGRGLWLTLVERPGSASGLDVLSLRTGLSMAPVLERFATRAVQVKWPNDLYVGDQKLGGILIEARWREQRPDWVAIGVGVNIEVPLDVSGAVGLGAGVTRSSLLSALVPALRAAAAMRGALLPSEIVEFDHRDFARGRQCSAPAKGVAHGITQDGALIIVSEQGTAHVRGGSLAFASETR